MSVLCSFFWNWDKFKQHLGCETEEALKKICNKIMIYKAKIKIKTIFVKVEIKIKIVLVLWFYIQMSVKCLGLQ